MGERRTGDPDLKSLAEAFNGVPTRLAAAFETQQAFTP